jgi:imidazoleglycerol phosphate synthase glutamine amidotransferase subunit HisH
MSSVVIKNNFVGCQFHPEKSSIAGEQFLDYFLGLK